MTVPNRLPPESLAKRAGILYSKGVAMGLGDSVPGVSGGTIAVITNIYDALVYSIRAVDGEALRLLLRGRFQAFWFHCNGSFLLILALGILSGLLISANTVLYLLENQFEALMAFFIGLVLASTYLLLPQSDLQRLELRVAILAGMLFTSALGFLDPIRIEPSLLYLFVAGAVAICAMILPGLSGAFILLLLGAYEHMLTALVEFRLATIIVFMLGCACGLLAFSRVLAWLLHNFHQLSYSFIIGMLLGSGAVLWPWQRAISFYTDSEGVQQVLQSRPVWPLNYTEITGQDPQLLAVAIALLGGAGTVLLLHRVFNGKPEEKS